MSNLRIKVKYGAFEIELDGETDTVREEFKEIKEKGLGNLLGKTQDFSESTVILSKPSLINDNTTDFNGTNYPSMKEITLKELPSSESEWVLLYAFYTTDYGLNYFKHADIIAMYESTNRKTDNRISNLSNSIKKLFKSEYFSAVNDEEYMITELGKKTILEILSRSPGKSSNGSKTNKKRVETKKDTSTAVSKSSKDFKLLPDLNLKPKGKASLIEYTNTFQLVSYPEKILIIVNYMKEVLDIEKVSLDHIFTGLRELKERVPNSFDTIVSNTKNRNGWLKFDTKDNISLSVQGSNYIIHDVKKKK